MIKISSNSGYVLQVDMYHEVRDQLGVLKMISISEPNGPLHNTPVHALHPVRAASNCLLIIQYSRKDTRPI